MTKTATLHLPRDNVNLFGLRTPANGAPPPTHDHTPRIITDPKLIQQLRESMKPQTAPHPNQRTPKPNPAKHQSKRRYYLPEADLITAHSHFADGIHTLPALALFYNVPVAWLKSQWRRLRLPFPDPQFTPPTE
jgi:hypothetical protein